MKYVIHINTQDPKEITWLLLRLAAEIIRLGPRNGTLFDQEGQPIGLTELHQMQ